jgi:ATP-dependent RNA helicase SUPV3L1/SUV3
MLPHGRTGITALLGPTNTGKTHRAIERMLDHPTGMIGLPLRLLAREVYDRITTRLGESAVALVTGEEKRVPPSPRYWVCTVEAMPIGREVDFLAVDEIQLSAHPERGHVFTDRLLSARGRVETWFLGSDTIRPLVERLVPVARIASHPRLSKLRAAGQSTLGALPPRSAVVAFSASRVYEIAERLREKRGGAAVVLGALSPRARNAQVALYQSGEVDYLVATDAIGMGLNLDVLHIAFADVHKFDGRESRPLELAELAQIAGRAGRYLNDGTFGTLAPLAPLSERAARSIECHAFPPERGAWWRNADLDFSSIPSLIESLKQRPRERCLKLAERALDFLALVELGGRKEVRARATCASSVALLWDVCRVPDFRGLLLDYHVTLLSEVFLQLSGREGRLDTDWVEERVAKIDDVEGDLDLLLGRMAAIRTFTYMSHRPGWIADAGYWQERTRTIEDRLSDALHARLVARFVDGGSGRRGVRSRSRPRRLPDGTEPDLPASDHPFGRLLVLRDALERREKAAPAPRGGERWLEDLVLAPHGRFRMDEHGRIYDGDAPISRLVRGADLVHPEVAVTAKELGSGARSRLQRRLVAWVRDLFSEMLGSLRHPSLGALSPAGRGIVYQLEQGLGSVRAADAGAQIGRLTAEDRERLLAVGLRFGALSVYLPSQLEPKAVEQRVAFFRAFHGDAPSLVPGEPSFAADARFDRAAYTALGYSVFGPRALRADVAEEVRGCLREGGSGVFELPSELAARVGCRTDEIVPVVEAFGYRAIDASRVIRRKRRRRSRKRSPNAA